jgi:hypothetical protein
MEMDKDEKFNMWMSKVEHQLQMMLKKSPEEFDYYDYYGDYINNVRPEQTAGRVIRRNRKLLATRI